ncbi:MAG: hypothetical protein H0T48_13230 [Gemmatimonadaceae bacterium]|nr:hypothetical protein [Gemmatimonadaceae bacterium]
MTARYILHPVPIPFNPRRLALGAARKFIFEGRDPETILERISGIDREGNILPTRLPTTEKLMSRSRERILQNLDEMYTEAFERAKESGDQSQMASLDFAYRREQLYFEILLDVRDALERR